MRSRFPFLLALFLLTLIGCGQVERERREAARKNFREIGKSLKQHDNAEREPKPLDSETEE